MIDDISVSLEKRNATTENDDVMNNNNQSKKNNILHSQNRKIKDMPRGFTFPKKKLMRKRTW